MKAFIIRLVVCSGILWAAQESSAQQHTYAAARGKYYGLVHIPGEEVHETSTFLQIELHALGSVSGRLVVAGRGRQVKGSVLPDGQTTLVLFRGKKRTGDSEGDGTEIDVKGNAWLQFDLSGETGVVWGRLVNTPALTFYGEKGAYNRSRPAPQTGKYTFLLPGGDGETAPEGAGFGTVDVSTDGRVKILMHLSDGRQGRQRVGLTGAGNLPVFMSMYDADGSVLGQLEMNEESPPGIRGTLWWTRPPAHAPELFPQGWTHSAEIQSSPYTRPAEGMSVLPYNEGILVLSGADLPAPLTYPFELDGPKVVPHSKGLVLKFVASTGFFHGSFPHPVTGKKVPFKGALLQNQSLGSGYFLTQDKLSGHAYLGPRGDG